MKLNRVDKIPKQYAGNSVSSDADLYTVIKEEEVVGFIGCRNRDYCVELEYIEIEREYRGTGIFKESVDELYKIYNKEIVGMAIPETYYNWKGIGAVISLTEEELAVYEAIGECIMFAYKG